MHKTNQQHDDLTEGTISSALGYIDANLPRREWARIAMALKAELGEDGFRLFDDWSKGGDTYSAKSARDTWKSIKPSGGVNVGTLIYQAQQGGFKFDEETERPRLTQADIDARKAKREQEARQAAAELKARHGEAARQANIVWNEALDADDSHPYLVAKGISGYRLRIGRWPLMNAAGEVFRHIDGALLIPIVNAKGKIVSLQGIMTDDHGEMDKRYFKNGQKQGGLYIIGTPAPGQPVALCEGYATGATIHRLTGWCVVVAFDEGNMGAIAATVRELFPGYEYIVAADNDAWTKRHDGTPYNPGVEAAQEVGREINARVIVPTFADTTTKPTDFNDLANLEGDEAAQAQLFAHIVRVPVPANDNEPKGRHIDTHKPLPDLSMGKDAKPLATIENLGEVCNRLGIVVRYNVISKEEELLIPNHAFTIDNAGNASLAWLISWCSRFRMPVGNIGDFVTYLADQNLYNPVAQWITSKPWDGVPRVQALCDTLTPFEDRKLPDGRRLRDVLVRRWLISAVAAAFQPDGVSAHGILTLQGEQYLGKTVWFKRLVPEHMGVIQDGMLLNPQDRDSVKQVCSFWMVELGELDATFRKSDIAALKAFITRKSDVLRRAYAKKESKFARRTVFFGSVNPRGYLHDPTGNRRYWTISCKHIDHEAQKSIDMQQMWAEVYAIWQKGEGFYLTPEEMAALNDHNEEFQVADPIEERLQTRLQWDADTSTWGWCTSTEALISVGMDRPTQGDATKAAIFIRKLNGGVSKRIKGKNLLFVPPKPKGKSGWDDDAPY
ncbi:VapE domain-containing protein [Tardiphaga sp. 20_F10_N6_6]|uniref:VapE domain-containing protein n=1 Tax=Tardiphaga sp. 20_F10_N6_6 TaxID=3240788 RepID=UPI003F898D34